MLKLLADENIAHDLVQWLRDQGCDVLHASESLTQEADQVLLQTAKAEERLLLTEDKDFGELVFRDHLNSRHYSSSNAQIDDSGAHRTHAGSVVGDPV